MLYDALMKEASGSQRGKAAAEPVAPGRQIRKILLERGRRVLKARRLVLRTAAPGAIHDLRVATRRLQAAIDLFAAHLPERPRRRLERRARAIRRRLGALRNAFVLRDLLPRITSRLPVGEKRCASALARRLEKTIAEGRRAGRRDGLPGLRKRLRRLLRAPAGASTTPDRPLTAGVPPADSLEHACREANGQDVEAMHRLRIAVKRHRYTLEILSEAGQSGLRPAIRQARALQGDLGGLHDLDLLIDLVHREAYRPGAGPLLRRLLRHRSRRAEAVTRRLSRFRSAGGAASTVRRSPRRAGSRAVTGPMVAA